MLAFEDEDIVNSSDIELVDTQEGGAYIKGAYFEKITLDNKTFDESDFSVGNIMDISGYIQPNDIENINNLRLRQYIKSDDKRCVIHTHAVIDMIINSTFIDCIAYHSLKGFIFKIETKKPYFLRSYKSTGTGDIGRYQPISTFLIKMVILSNDDTKIDKLPAFENTKKESETVSNLFNEAKIQQDIYRNTLNKTEIPVCPAVMSFFHMSNLASMNLLDKMDLFKDAVDFFGIVSNNSEKNVSNLKARIIVNKLYNISIQIICNFKIEKKFLNDADNFEYIPMSNEPTKKRYINFIEKLLVNQNNPENNNSFVMNQDKRQQDELFVEKIQNLYKANEANKEKYYSDKLNLFLDVVKRFNILGKELTDQYAYITRIHIIPDFYKREYKNGEFVLSKKKLSQANEENVKAFLTLVEEDLNKYKKTSKKTQDIIDYLKDSVNTKYRLGIIAMEYASNYDTYSNVIINNSQNQKLINDNMPNIFANIIIAAMTTQYVNCDLHNSNIMINKEQNYDHKCYLIDFGRTIKLNNYNKKCFPTENDIKVIKFIDPVKDVPEGTFENMYNISNKGKRTSSLVSDEFKNHVKQFIITMLKNIALHELSYNIEHFHKNIFQTKYILSLLKSQDQNTKIFSNSKEAIEWLNAIFDNINEKICFDIFKKILDFFYKKEEDNTLVSQGYTNINAPTLNSLLDLSSKKIKDESIYYVDLKSQQIIRIRDKKFPINPTLLDYTNKTDKEFNAVFDHINQSEITKMDIKYNELFFTYAPGMLVLCKYSDEYKIHVVYKIYDGMKPVITLLTLEHYTYIGEDQISLLAIDEIPTKTLSLMSLNGTIYEFVDKNMSILPLAMLIAFQEYGSQLSLQNKKLFTIEDFFSTDLDINHDETIATSLQPNEKEKIKLFCTDKDYFYNFYSENIELIKFCKSIENAGIIAKVENSYAKFIKNISKCVDGQKYNNKKISELIILLNNPDLQLLSNELEILETKFQGFPNSSTA